MSAEDNNPLTTNMQAKQWFKFQLKRAPSLTYFCQTVNIPKISAIETVNQPTPFLNIPKSYDHLTFDPLVATFQVDGNLQNYLEIYNWMIAASSLYNSDINSQRNPINPYGVYSDISLFIMDSQYTPKYVFNFENAFPISLGEMTFDTTVKDTEYVYCEVNFAYIKYSIDTI